MRRSILIYGSRQYSETIEHLAAECGLNCAGKIDDFDTTGGQMRAREAFALAKTNNYRIAVGVGYRDLKLRSKLLKKIRESGVKMETLIHPSASIGLETVIGEGSIVMAGATIGPGCKIGVGSVLWPNTCISHNSVIGQNVFLSPGCIICGNASIGSSSFIGAGSIIVDNGRLRSHSFIKMGTIYKARR